MHQENEPKLIPRQILWEKWRDPFGQDGADSEWPGAHGTFQTDDIIRSAKEASHGETSEEEYEAEEEKWQQQDIEDANAEMYRQHSLQNQSTPQMMMTPIGLIPITEHTLAGKIFNFWTGHTSFRMNKTVEDILNNVPGVETLDTYTPYRFRIAVGKAFDSSEVKSWIMKSLNCEPPST